MKWNSTSSINALYIWTLRFPGVFAYIPYSASSSGLVISHTLYDVILIFQKQLTPLPHPDKSTQQSVIQAILSHLCLILTCKCYIYISYCIDWSVLLLFDFILGTNAFRQTDMVASFGDRRLSTVCWLRIFGLPVVLFKNILCTV